MPYEPLHHKYRPQTFAELVGQEAIAQTLTNALQQQRIAPAYLFTGARGTGKTSSARIFAKSLNCLKSEVPTADPCGICQVCREITRGASLDIIEIDAASNTGVDNIRELIERAQFAPVQCRYKVYVIDEVHMLSTAAFNALLKTLEEPPDRVVFVLATTDPQKVLPTIISRCQRFDFRRIPLTDMVAHLAAIATQEAILITADAIQLVAQIAQGGLRDAESLLDQLSLLQGEITSERVWDLVGAVPERDLLALVQAIAQDTPALVLDKVRHLMDRGREPLIVLQNFASFYRDLLIAKTAPDRHDLVAITPPTWTDLCAFVQGVDITWILSGQKHLRASEMQVKNTSQPRLWLEVTLMGLLPSAIASQTVGTGQGQHAAPGTNGHAQELRQPSPPQSNRASTPAPPAPQPPPTPVPPPIVAEAADQQGKRDGAEEGRSQPIDQPAADSLGNASTASPGDGDGDRHGEESINLQKVWRDVLALVQPISTQTMLRQQCHLIAFNGQEARIGTNSQPLFKMAKDRMPNIEAAFQKFCQQPIKVSLEVANPNESQTATKTESDANPEPKTQPSPPVQPPPPVQPNPSAQSIPPALPTPVPEPPIDAAIPSAHPPTHPLTPPPSSSPVVRNDGTEPPLTQVPWQAEDDVRRAAKSLAQMFNGQIVSLEDGPETIADSTDFTVTSQTANQPTVLLNEDDAEDDDDVPF